MKPAEGARTVLEGSARLVACVEQRSDRAEFMAGPAFARFCEYWGRFAKQVRREQVRRRAGPCSQSITQAGDLRTLDQIGRLSQGGGGSDADSESDRAVIETSALSTTLARALAVFEAWQGRFFAFAPSSHAILTSAADHTADIVDKLREASSAIKRCGPSLEQSGEDHDRVKRGVERLRRAVVKIVEPPTSAEAECPPEVRTCARAILEDIVNVLCEKVSVPIYHVKQGTHGMRREPRTRQPP